MTPARPGFGATGSGARETPASSAVSGWRSASWNGSTTTLLPTAGPAQARSLALVPDGTSFVAGGACDVQGGGEASGLVTATDVDDLVVHPPSASLSLGGAQTLDLVAGLAHAGELFLVLGSLAGTTPGLPVLGGATLPLAIDGYSPHTLTQPGAPPLAGAFGALDADGRARATFAVPPGSNPAFAGAVAHRAYALLHPVTGPPTFDSVAAPVTLAP